MKTTEKEPEKGVRVKGYANLLCDFMFKRLFGSEANKDVLIEFLNMVLEDTRILHVDFIPTEHHGLTEEDRKVVFDLSCRCSDGRTFIIEMQNGFQRHFRKRALYYTTYPINGQGRVARDLYFKEKAEGRPDAKFRWDYDLKPVIVVAILNFRFEHSEGWPQERLRSSYRLREDTSGEQMTDVLRFVFLELKRFRKRVWELETMYDKWIWLLGHMHELETIPENFTEPLFKRLFFMSELGNFTAEEYTSYLKSLDNMGDYDNIIQTAAEDAHARGLAEGREKGLAEGLVQGEAKGREEGKAEGREDVARNLKALGVDISVIVQASGLTEEQVKALD